MVDVRFELTTSSSTPFDDAIIDTRSMWKHQSVGLRAGEGFTERWCILVLILSTKPRRSVAVTKARGWSAVVLLLYRCCCCNCCGCAVALEIPQEVRKCGFVSPCSLCRILAPLWRFCGRSKREHGTHTRTQMRRPWPSQKEEHDERLLLYRRRCHNVDNLRAWGTVWYRYDTAAAASRAKQTNEKAELWGSSTQTHRQNPTHARTRTRCTHTAHTRKQNAHTRKQNAHTRKQNAHTRKQNAHTRKQNAHTRKQNAHTSKASIIRGCENQLQALVGVGTRYLDLRAMNASLGVCTLYPLMIISAN